MSTPVFNSWYNHASSSAGMQPRIGHSTVVRQKPSSPSCQLEGPRQSVGVHGEDEQKKCVKGWKWVKVGENPKMPYPPCGRSIKTYARGNNDAPSVAKYGSLVRLDAQIVALRPQCTCTALRAPPVCRLADTRSWGCDRLPPFFVLPQHFAPTQGNWNEGSSQAQ